MRAVGVVVPAHDEEALLPACLSALRVAAAAVDVDVRVLVVLDSCTDGSADACEGVGTLHVRLRSAGAARAAGMAALLAELLVDDPLEEIWLATTDADSQVAPDWLSEQLRLADAGADAVFGIVDVDDAPAAFRYPVGADGSHPHRHGACLGLRASSLARVGGMPPVQVGEDQALSDALVAQGAAVVSSTAVRVLTSGRRTSRVVGGFATLLASLA